MCFFEWTEEKNKLCCNFILVYILFFCESKQIYCYIIVHYETFTRFIDPVWKVKLLLANTYV